MKRCSNGIGLLIFQLKFHFAEPAMYLINHQFAEVACKSDHDPDERRADHDQRRDANKRRQSSHSESARFDPNVTCRFKNRRSKVIEGSRKARNIFSRLRFLFPR